MQRSNLLPASVLALFISLFLYASPATAGDVFRATLKNGLKVVIIQNSLAPVVTSQINYLVGSNDAPSGYPGMAHALEHMMFRGSPGLSADQLAAVIAGMGGEFNADTQQSITQYFFTIASSDLAAALKVEAIRMKGLLHDDSLWQAERNAIEQEVVQDLSNPEYVLNTKLLELLFDKTPYAHDALGTRPSFNDTTAAMLHKFHRDWYAPNNAILIIAGDVKPKQTLALVRRLFEAIPSRPLPPRIPVNLVPLKPASLALDSDLPYGLALVAYRLPGYDDPDYAAGQILADVLSSQRAKLYSLVPEGKALSAGFDSFSLAKASAGYATAAFPPGYDGKTLLDTLKTIISGYVKNGVPADLVAAAKRHEIAQAEFQKNSISGLADAWSQALAVEGRSSPDDDIRAFRKVTTEDVNRVARAYLDNQTAITGLLTPRQSGKPVESRGFSRSKESFAPKRVQNVALPPWASYITKVPAPAATGQKTADFRLANGLRLIVRHTAVSKTVSVYGRVKNNPDLQSPKGKEGVDELLDNLFSYGTTSLDRLAYQAALDDIAAESSVGTSFSLDVLKEHFQRGIALMADNLLHPALPEDAFTVVRKETADALAGQEKSPGWLASRALRKALFPVGDPSLRHATPASVSALTLADVRDYYQSVFRPDMTTIVVIGDITPAEAKQAVEKQFGTWRAKGMKPETDPHAVPNNLPTSVSVPDSSRVQDEVTMAETMGLTRAHPDYYPLQLGLHILSGAFYATRLYRDLREEAGLVYMVEAFLQAGKNRSIFGVVYGCDPGNNMKASAMIERDLEEMRKDVVTPTELRQARTLLIRQLQLEGTSTSGIANELLALSLADLPLDEPQRASQRYRKITAAQIKQAFSSWIRPGGFAHVSQGPSR